MRPSRIALLCALVFLSAGPALAQCTRSRPGEASKYNLFGRVVNTVNNMDVPAAVVKVTGRNDRKMAFSDGQGRFYFLCLEADFYTVEVNAEGFLPAVTQIDLLSGTSSDEVIRVQPAETVKIQPTGDALSVRQIQVPEQARKLFEKGVEELHQNKRPERSVEYFQKAIESYLDYDEAYVQLGIAYARLSELDKAEAIFRRALAVYPKNARAHTFLGKFFYQQGKLDDAAAELRAALEIDNNLWLAHLDLARILAKQGKAKESYDHAKRAHELNRDIEDTHLAYYNACATLHDYAAALAELEEFVKLYPASEVSKKMLAMRDKLAHEVPPRPQ